MPLLPDLGELLRFDVSPLELILRGSVMYWALFLMLRFIMRRDTGSIGIPDILLLVLIADAAQNAMAGGYQTLAEGFVLVATLVGWNWLMDWASFRFKRVRRFVEPPPLVLVRHGRLLLRNMRREFVTVPELMASLRTHGIDKLADVKIARMEPDGGISVIREAKPADDDEGADEQKSLPV
ncbi:uncharacterized membrane protein YcaP (DUF421 family) [Pelomonas saccharophila]|jgi:uncharacterized membrane protein YcaP (DUF421 family)|uniref:Uncharacterized membrane protein YcaP (DUF421 family) n=1 Tax=Roseateles saccharophilus TaxID=304 RepID=A0ABU1YKC7_ROSSA|nr:YetF domain-containing protein [Roseateles saccharophilus]MDR7268641.1 uncharacterized membrane protein YcaP (DUF421 family) [Roseateles saccharophilus]